ncbi:hypothetical protein BDV19DRAFT_377109 [Aspergillus venezuelensis]
MAKSGKKNKKADNGKQKNKKGKAQEEPEAETAPAQHELSSDQPEEQQLAVATPLPEEVSDPTAAPTPEAEWQPAPGVAPEPTTDLAPEPAPESTTDLKEAEPEQTQPAEHTETPFDFNNPFQSPVGDDGFTEINKPGTPLDQSPSMVDAPVQDTQEPSHEELGAWEKLDTAEAKIEDESQHQEDKPVETAASEQTTATTPQSPVFTLAPETATEATEPWPAWDEPSKELAVQEEVTSTNNTAASFPPTNPFVASVESELASEPAQASEPAATPEPEPEVEPEFQEPEAAREPEPAKEPEPVPEPTAEPEPALANEHDMGAEVAVDPAQEVTPPASKPSSPAPATASPSFKSASPMQRAMSPATLSVADTVDGPHAFPPIPPPAAPTPPNASPKTQHAPSVKEAAVPTPSAAPPTPPNASPVYPQSYPMDQPWSPRQKSVSSSHRHASPAPKPSSPLPKVSSPLANHFASPVMSPHSTSVPPMPPSFPPSVSHSYATAYQSPAMSAQGYYPQQYGYYQPTSYPHAVPRGSLLPNGSNSYPGTRDQGYPNDHVRAGHFGPPEQEDTRELLDRIQESIPDINRLLGTFKQTKTKLQSREAEFKQMESQHKQALMHKEFFIEALQNQLRKTANESAEEATKLKNTINELRMELGNLEEKRKDMEEKIADSETTIRKLNDEKAERDAEIKKLNETAEAERVAHAQELEKQRAEKEAEKEQALATQKQELTELFEEIKAEDEKAAADALAARETELQEQQEAMKQEYEQQKQQMQESHDTLQADFDSKLAELATTKKELEAKNNELEDTRKEHAEQVESMEKSHHEKVTDLETQLSDKSEELANSEKENRRLEEDVLQKEKQVGLSVDNMRLTIENLDKDCDRLRKTLSSLGEATDLKNTKGDSFFLDCFEQLHRLIVTLSKEHFSYLPIDPPQEVLSKLPPELPSFLDNTPASRELRSLYVQHVVSKTLTYRIFHPFLFTLGRRYDKADILFQMLSMDIRRKSVRREAFWRQQTLKAAYTTSDAKDSINVVAAVIVDEISNHLKHFADPRRMDSLLTGIRKIVKLAAETWRHARVERELILAALPAPEDGNIPGEDWEEYGAPHDSGRASPSSTSSKLELARHVVLRPFPRIIREAAHEDFVGDEKKANPCTYSRGAVLYSDSPIILARREELARKSTESLVGDAIPRRRSHASNRSGPPSPLPYMPNDTLIEGATGANFGTL